MSTDDNKIVPIRPVNFKSADHSYRRFDATVPGHLKPEDLLQSELWQHVAPQCPVGSEIRAVADDFSFVAYLFVTYSMGTNIRVQMVHSSKLDDVEKIEEPVSDYEVKLCGQKKWCVRKRSTGEIFKEGIPTQIEALKELEDYMKALAA